MDVNPTWINPISDQLPQPPPFDTIFDLAPLPEMHLLQPEPGPVNLAQGQSSQPTEFSGPEVRSIDLGQQQGQHINPNPEPLNWENVFSDSGLSPCMNSVPLFSPLSSDFEYLMYMLDSLEQPSSESPS
jgi:hypothetical protein